MTNEPHGQIQRKIFQRVKYCGFFVPYPFHCLSKHVVCFYYCLLLFWYVWKKFICHSNVDSVREWQSGGRGYQPDKWQSSAGWSTCKCDPWWCALSASPSLSKVGHDLFGSGGTKICLDDCHRLSENKRLQMNRSYDRRWTLQTGFTSRLVSLKRLEPCRYNCWIWQSSGWQGGKDADQMLRAQVDALSRV